MDFTSLYIKLQSSFYTVHNPYQDLRILSLRLFGILNIFFSSEKLKDIQTNSTMLLFFFSDLSSLLSSLSCPPSGNLTQV